MRLKPTPCEGAAAHQGITVPLTRLRLGLLWLRGNRASNIDLAAIALGMIAF